MKIYIVKISVTKCGFIINPKWPWLGTSPDGILFTDKIIAIKINCPYSKKDLTIVKACKDKTFFLL